MPHTNGLGAKPIPDEDYIKPFLNSLSPSTEEAHHVCPSEAFQAIYQCHHVLQPFYTNEVFAPAIKASACPQSKDNTLLDRLGSSPPID